MTRWKVDGPQRITLDEPVTRLDVRLVSGRLNVVASDGPARVDVTRVSSQPVIVELRDGRLVVAHERPPRWPGVLWWLGQLGRRFRAEVSIAVPAHVLADLQLVDGSLVASGLRRDTRVDVTSGQGCAAAPRRRSPRVRSRRSASAATSTWRPSPAS